MFFGRPEMLWLLAVATPLLSLFYWHAWKTRQRLIRRFVQSRLLAVLTVGVSPRRQKARMALVVLAVTLALLALARPLWGYAIEEYTRRGVDILVAIDTSRSMLAQDVQPNRLTRAKLAALDLMKLAEGDRLGLIAFAGSAFLQCPLTIDWAAFEESVNALDTEVILQQGTALAQAIETAIETFQKEGDNFKALVVFSDGEDHEAGVAAAARKAAAAGIRIYAVGVGTPEGDRIRQRNANGEIQYLTDEQGHPVVTKLNDGILRRIAQITNGDYLPLQGADPMKQLYENRIALLPRSEYGARMGRRYFDRYQWPLGLALLLLVIEMLLPCRRRVTQDAVRSAPAGAVGKLAGLWLCLLISAGGESLQASVRQAMRAYEAGDYRTAWGEFQRAIAEGRDDPRLHFNAGVAAYRLHQYEEAANELSAAILSSDPKLLPPAYYNLGNTLFRMGENASDPAQKKQRWESALKAYEAALKLNPGDPDAAFNRDVVRAKLEQLKKQQQQQQQQGQQQKDQQDQQQQQNQPPKNQQKQDQSSQSQQQKDQRQQQKQPSRKKKQDQQQDRSQPKPKQEQKKPQKSKQQPARPPKPKPGQTNETRAAQARPRNQMTPEQARRLLEAARNQEHLWFEAERRRQAHSVPSSKPW